VNLPAGESRTDPLPIEELERKGVSISDLGFRIADSARDANPQSAIRNPQRFAEMESQQKLWRWVLIATSVMLLMEVWLGGWLTRPNPASGEEQT
jgi:hypothetical protein